MAALEYTTAQYSNAGIASRVAHAFTSVFASVAAWNDARVTRNTLSALSDHELNDIGLIRGDIDGIS